MNLNTTPDNQTILLIDAFLQGTISDEQQQKLEQLLAADSEQRQLYIDYMQVHNGLASWANETTASNGQSSLPIEHNPLSIDAGFFTDRGDSPALTGLLCRLEYQARQPALHRGLSPGKSIQ